MLILYFEANAKSKSLIISYGFEQDEEYWQGQRDITCSSLPATYRGAGPFCE